VTRGFDVRGLEFALIVTVGREVGLGVIRTLLGTLLPRWGEAFVLPMLTETSRAAIVLLTLPSFRYSRWD
jgi:hypothetical protein